MAIEFKEYVVGLLFTEKDEVLLIEKKRPEWQAGRFNGIGGKVEADETATQAMHREFKEEAGGPSVDWRQFLVLEFDGGAVHFFTATIEDLEVYEPQTDEELVIADTHSLPEELIPNLNWIIPMAVEYLLTGAQHYVKEDVV